MMAASDKFHQVDTLGALAVIFGAIRPRIVGDLVVVPDRHHRVLAVQFL